MKGFRRYGGEFDGRTHGGNDIVGAIGVLLLVVFSALSLLLNKPGLVLLGLLSLFLFSIISMFVPGGHTSGMREKRHAALLEKAFLAYKKNDLEEAFNLYNKSKIYKELSGVHLDTYIELSEKVGRP